MTLRSSITDYRAEYNYLTNIHACVCVFQRRHWSLEQKEIAIVRELRGIRANSQEIATLMLQDGTAINSIRCDTTALCEAKSGNLKTVSLLLASGASVDDRDATQQAPLHHACDWNNIEVIKILLKKKCTRISRIHAVSRYRGMGTRNYYGNVTYQTN